MLPDQIADRIISVLPSQAEMGVKQAALSSDQLLLGSQYPLLPLASGSQPSLLPGFGIPPDSNPVSAMGATQLMQPPIGPNGPVGHFFWTSVSSPSVLDGGKCAGSSVVSAPAATAATAATAAAPAVTGQLARQLACLPRQQLSNQIGRLGRCQQLTVAARPAARWREDRQ